MNVRHLPAQGSAEAAYLVCEGITRARARNFYYGIRLLPLEKRRAMCAVYALARRIDDIGDGDLPRDEKFAQLAAVRADLAAIEARVDDPVLVAVADAQDRFGLPFDAFCDLVDGVEMDVVGTEFERFDDLVGYCRRVAGTIGRLSLAVFGNGEPQAEALADDLGVALQLTNILRDVREDREQGRFYLPQEDLRRFGCDGGDLDGAPLHAWVALLRFEAARNREWFDRGLQLLPLLDARSAACVATMAGIYRGILDRIERQPEEVLRGRISLPAWEKGWVAMRSMARAAAAG
jgi:15-cis-phytoene synthase